ncbi:DNA (cytosine-5-)-methyltransferase [Burkholderia sp. Ax-1719]|uniref:DNA (cytosine-5-)-methyltransferase n=1 Tax=Burkholderia sp. Ax-1719 TaxID=2608334 RepID=UPI00141FCBB3|nr:DNA (cytosine-5-)-methyltransferase [Burkholderia sp. Ax-1719]NIE63056.1 DNA (cytosine-5-)-methyltransferase [Burkholderia sp. Ax-1719]
MSETENSKRLRVADLFAGVGGFRLGLESVHGEPYEFTFSNQFEPSTKVQHASAVYQAHWHTGEHINRDINEVLNSADGQQAIRNASPDVVVGGFPCQDYSVARPLTQSSGLAGKKGVLWWSIAQFLQQCISNGKPAKYLIFENVDRLLSSPANHRGRDFAVILSTLRAFGYAAEWRVINAADYGHAQRRRRTFIVAYHQTTDIYRRMLAATVDAKDSPLKQTLLFDAFPCDLLNPLDAVHHALTVADEPLNEQLRYHSLSNGRSRFGNIGLMVSGSVYTCQSKAHCFDDYSAFSTHRSALTLGDIVRKTGPVPTEFYIKPEDEQRWITAKGAKSTARSSNGFEYTYKEGKMAFPDVLDLPSRTIITSEGGTTPSRTKHSIRDASGKLRRLTPEELEDLCGFPRGFTDIPGISSVARARLMGNSLVVPLVQRIGEALYRAHLHGVGTTARKLED